MLTSRVPGPAADGPVGHAAAGDKTAGDKTAGGAAAGDLAVALARELGFGADTVDVLPGGNQNHVVRRLGLTR